MSLIDRLFGARRNNTKPFYENSGVAEIKRWFETTKPWDKIDASIVDALIAKLSDKGVLFEVFVLTSMENNLVNKYIEISSNKDLVDGRISIAIISESLTRLGQSYVEALKEIMSSESPSKAELSRLFNLATDTLEVAIALDSNQALAYFLLAQVKVLLGKEAEGLDLANRALATIRDLKGKNVPFPNELRQGMDQLEMIVSGFLRELQKPDYGSNL